MDKKIIKIVLERADMFSPMIFTKNQIEVIRKYYCGISLNNAEKKALYTSITKKFSALESLSREQKDKEYFINGNREILPGRLEKARKLLDEYGKRHNRVFISGSFLFSRTYNDIDIFIIRKRGYKEVWEGNRHIIFLSEKRLCSPVFQSASLISVSNFRIPKKMHRKKQSLSELMSTYHEAVIEHIRKEKKTESMRDLVFNYNLFCRNRLLNPKELSRRTRLENLDKMMMELCRTLFSRSYLYVSIYTYIKTLRESVKNIKPNSHLKRYMNTYEELIYERSKAEAA